MRLTNSMRETLVEDIEAATLRDRGVAIATRGVDLFAQVRVKAFGQHYDAAMALPGSFFPTARHAKVFIADAISAFQITNWDLGNNGVWTLMSSHKLSRPATFPRKGMDSYGDSSQIQLAGDDKLVALIERYSEDIKAFEEDRKRLRNEVRAVVNSVTTTEKLIAVWPEMKDMIVPLIKTAETLPAIQADHLNDMLAAMKVA